MNRRAEKIKSISGKIVENAKEVDPVVFDAKPRAAEHRRAVLSGGDTMKRKLLGWGAALIAVAAGFSIWQDQMEVQANRSDHPKYVVDPS